MLKGEGITSIECSYLYFFCVYFLRGSLAHELILLSQLGDVEYVDCISAERQDTP